jgi:flagellar basal-body rod protein FlgG
MSGAIYLGAAGMAAQQLRLQLQSENLANADSPGYRREALAVRLSEAQESGAPPPAVLPVHSRIDETPGRLQATGNPLDLALEGGGYFAIDTPDGVRYTRNGSFQLDPTGVLVTADGHPVLGEAGPLILPDGPVSVTPEGQVESGGAVVGRLRIGDFPGNGAMRKAGNGRFGPADPEAVEIRPARVNVVQGSLEGANVEPVAELTGMIATQRLFQSYQRIIQAADEMDQKAATELGRVE